MEWMLGVRMMINMMHYGSNNGYFWAGAVKHPRIEETKLETQGKEQYNKHISCQVMKNILNSTTIVGLSTLMFSCCPAKNKNCRLCWSSWIRTARDAALHSFKWNLENMLTMNANKHPWRAQWTLESKCFLFFNLEMTVEQLCPVSESR